MHYSVIHQKINTTSLIIVTYIKIHSIEAEISTGELSSYREVFKCLINTQLLKLEYGNLKHNASLYYIYPYSNLKNLS